MKAMYYFPLMMIIVLMGCSNDVDLGLRPKERMDIELSRSEKVMANENVDFSFRFFQQINQSTVNTPNLMVSPYSVSMALAMLANGADANTLAEIKDVLGFSEADLDEMNSYFQRITQTLLDLDNTTKLGITNSIWVDNDLTVYESFRRVNEDMYDAKVGNIDFSNAQEANQTINEWCAMQTNDLIKKPVSNLSPDVRMMLLNALYFKGIWHKNNKFTKENTVAEDFTNADGNIVEVQMMNMEKELNFAYNECFYMARFPYGNNAFCMTVYLPVEGMDLDNALKALTYENWLQWSLKWSRRTLVVKFPKFEISTRRDLKDDLIAMGMEDTFDSQSADFSALSSESLCLGLLKQDTYIKVDEEGTEAVAVTQSGGDESVGPPSSGPVNFYLNRPFAFTINETSTNTVLFMGKVTEM
jgi:serpin B